MSKLEYTREEIEAEHNYAAPHEVCGMRLHGGFDAEGNYLSPRTLHRWDAIGAWQAQLEQRGVPLVEATTRLLTQPNFPSVEQQLFLLRHGVNQSLWDSLTITGLIEARGGALATLAAPEFQPIIEEDITGTALSHMNLGLMRAHGWDEAGVPGSGLGGHDSMWFAARDLLFGKDAFAIPTPPTNIGRQKEGREMEQLPAPYEMLISFLMNLLMIEVRAERAFNFYESVITTRGVFEERPADAAVAAALVNRIRKDESVHVAWLTTAVSEFRSFTIKTVDGDRVPGCEILDPIWERMVYWHAVEMIEANRDAARGEMRNNIKAAGVGEDVLEEFETLAA